MYHCFTWETLLLSCSHLLKWNEQSITSQCLRHSLSLMAIYCTPSNTHISIISCSLSFPPLKPVHIQLIHPWFYWEWWVISIMINWDGRVKPPCSSYHSGVRRYFIFPIVLCCCWTSLLNSTEEWNLSFPIWWHPSSVQISPMHRGHIAYARTHARVHTHTRFYCIGVMIFLIWAFLDGLKFEIKKLD